MDNNIALRDMVISNKTDLDTYKANCKKMIGKNRNKLLEAKSALERLQKSGAHPKKTQDLKREVEGWRVWVNRWAAWLDSADEDWAAYEAQKEL